MSKQWPCLRNETGGLLLVALMFLLVITLLAITITDVAWMDFKCSQNDFTGQQAQQAADGGIELAEEKIFQELNQLENLQAETLPQILSCGNLLVSIPSQTEPITVAIGGITYNAVLSDSGSCSYEFTSRGEFRNASKVISVVVSYHFIGGYSHTEADGTVSFVPREYLDRGQIISYRAIF